MHTYRLQNKRDTGFSLVELLVTVALAAVILAVAVPSFTGLFGSSKISASTNEFVASIHTTRSEAIKRNTRAAMCPSASPTSAAATCDNSADWSSGWIVFVDDDEDGQRDDPAEEILHSAEPLSNGFSISTVPASSSLKSLIYFDTDGSSIAAGGTPVAGDVEIRYGADELRTLSVSVSGRVKLTRGP